jgi:hypothetical protein
MHPIGIDQRVTLGFNYFDVLETGGFEMIGYELGGAMRGLVVLGQRRDAGDAKKVLQLFEEPWFVFFNVAIYGLGHVASF